MIRINITYDLLCDKCSSDMGYVKMELKDSEIKYKYRCPRCNSITYTKMEYPRKEIKCNYQKGDVGID